MLRRAGDGARRQARYDLSWDHQGLQAASPAAEEALRGAGAHMPDFAVDSVDISVEDGLSLPPKIIPGFEGSLEGSAEGGTR
jgi:hypothetical protein